MAGVDIWIHRLCPNHVVSQGSLDILVLQLGQSSATANRVPYFIINNYFNDAFFLKGLGTYITISDYSLG